MRTMSFDALGTSAVVAVTADDTLGDACAELVDQLERLDRVCSRFRSDSELARVNARAGEITAVSPLLAELIGVALDAARSSDGLVDPTLGGPLRAVGYDRTFTLVRDRETWTIAERPVVPESWRWVELDRRASTVRLPTGIELDLGATAKAWASDQAARAIAEQSGGAALVSLGGDIAVAGVGVWPIRIAESHLAPLDGPGPVVAIETGGLATSSTTVRRWRTTTGDAHHVLDPSTGRPAAGCWRTVSVTAASCLEANVASTAAIVLGDAAPNWLESRGLPARLVGLGGEVVVLGGWPADAVAA